jgi:hypothetical protein
MLQAKERDPTPSLSTIFTFGLTMSPSRSLGVHLKNGPLNRYKIVLKITQDPSSSKRIGL